MKGRRALYWGSFVVSLFVFGSVLAEKAVKPTLPTGCQQGEVAKWNGVEWVCSPDFVSVDASSISCEPGRIPRSTGGGWECVDDPTDRVSSLEVELGKLTSVTRTVDCSNGESLQIVLDQEIGYRVGPVTIEIKGFCDENIHLRQSDITFRPTADSAPGAGVGSLYVAGSREVVLENLRVARGVGVGHGGTLSAENLLVDEPDHTNVNVSDSSYASLTNPTLTNCLASCIEVGNSGSVSLYHGELKGIPGQPANGGVVVSEGGSINLFGTIIRGFTNGMGVANGGSAYLDSVLIEGGTAACAGCGAIIVQGSVNLFSSTISNNAGDGIVVQVGGKVSIIQGVISGNAAGVTSRGGSVYIQETGILGNDGAGIVARNLTSLQVVHGRIAGNGGDGIRLGDVSFLEVGGFTEITGNSGWGLYCSPAPAVAQYTEEFPGSMVAHDNVSGDISCPYSVE